MKNLIKSVLIVFACFFGHNIHAQVHQSGPQWVTHSNTYFKFSYLLPNNFCEMQEVDPGVMSYTYYDGIEIITYGQFNYGLWNKYLEHIESDPILKIYKNNWFVVSDDNGDGTEYYTRCGTYKTYIEGSYSEVVATMIINYPKSAKKRAQQIIQKCFKNFPTHY